MHWHHGNLMAKGGAPKSWGSPACLEFNAEGTIHVFYRASGGHLVELWWSGQETPHHGFLTKGHGAHRADGDSNPTCHVVNPFDPQATLHVVYYSDRGHIEDLSWSGSDFAHPKDLTPGVEGKLGITSGTLTSHVDDADGSQHVFFVDSWGHIKELSWIGDDDPDQRDLTTAQNGAMLSSGKPASYVLAAADTQQLFYRSCGHIVELSWRGPDFPRFRDLSSLSDGAIPPAVGDPSHLVFPDGSQHVFYDAGDGSIVELSWQGNLAPHATVRSFSGDGSPSSASSLASFIFDDGSRHVLFFDQFGAINDLTWTGDEPAQRINITEEFGAPRGWGRKPLDTLASLVYSAEGTHHVFYTAAKLDIGTDVEFKGDIIELWA
jgi:hypothetical protein